MFILKKCNNWIAHRISIYGAQHEAFIAFCFIFYIFNPFKWRFTGEFPKSPIFILRVAAIFILLLLLIKKYWPSWAKTYLPLYWYFALFYFLPFRTTFNILNSPHVPMYESFGPLGFLALGILVDSTSFLLLSSFGILAGGFSFFVLGQHNISLESPLRLAYFGLLICSIAFIKFIFFNNHQKIFKERIKAMSIFASAIAHELRTPLSIVTLESGYLLNKNPKVIIDESYEKINRIAKKSLLTIESILNSLKFIETKPKIKISPINLKESLINTIESNLFTKAEQKKITLKDLNEVIVLGEEQLLSQVFINLIKNALRSIEHKHDGFLKISMQKLNKEKMTSLTFYDNGIGLAPEKAKEIFRLFESNSERGFGVGLAFCKIALNKMEGDIKATGQENKFASFEIFLKEALNA